MDWNVVIVYMCIQVVDMLLSDEPEQSFADGFDPLSEMGK